MFKKGQRSRKSPTKGIKKKVSSIGFPRSDADRKFCERWLTHFDHLRAYREAGFNMQGAGTRSAAKLVRFREYLRPLQEAKARIVAEKIALDQADVLEALTAKVTVDPKAYIQRTDKPLTREVKTKDKTGKEVVALEERSWNGKPIYGERYKPFCELTPAEARAVEIVSDSGDTIRYRLPSIREQHKYLHTIGQQLGMFLQKIIFENHQHRHQHAHLHLENVPTAKLQSLTRQLLPLVGEEYAKSLGYTPEEFAEATADEGVIMPKAATG